MFDSIIYKRSPIVVQTLLLSLMSLVKKVMRNGKPYKKYVTELEASQWLNSEKLTKLTQQKLADMIELASKKTEFYKGLNSLDAIPYVEKHHIRKNNSRFLITNISKKNKLFKNKTGGTTGTPLELYQDIDAICFEQAHIQRFLSWAGYKKGDRIAWLRADKIVPLEQTPPPFWRRNYADNMLMFSAYHLTSDNVGSYLWKLEQFDPVIIQAYPSSILYIARYMKVNRIFYKGTKLKSVVTSSETISSEDKQLIFEVFGVKVFDWYGNSERNVAIGTCEQGNYHVISDYCYFETRLNELGQNEIIGTGFGNKVMPLIRYCTGDTIELSDQKDCPCGRSFPIIEKVNGRVGDFLIGDKGNKVFILNHIPKDVQGLLELQLVQEQHNLIEARCVVNNAFDKSSEHSLTGNIKKYLGKGTSVTIQVVDKIPRTKNGKFRQSICTLQSI